MSRQTRREELRQVMDRLGALVLRRPANFAWYTGGADNRVDHAAALGVAGILLTAETEHVLTDNIEAPRMREEATRPGRTLAVAFDDCRRFYAEEEFPDAWKDHHQGGLTGYASRESIAGPQTQYEIRPHQAFAWNPSLVGAKAEESFVLTDAGPEVIAPS